jgi:hypothetical protein
MVLFLNDDTATFDLPELTGEMGAAADAQRHTLATMAFGFAEALSCGDACWAARVRRTLV